MKKDRFSNLPKLLLLLFLLASICISATELAACRQYAPELYYQITEPARQGARAAVRLSQRAIALVAAQTEKGLEQAAQLAEQAGNAWYGFLASLPRPAQDSQAVSEPSAAEYDPSDPSITELRQTEDGQVLTGGIIEIVYFNQGDPLWAGQPYGSDDIGRYGCGPTAMAMAVSSMTDQSIDPAVMAEWAVDHGYWAKSGGSYLSIIEGTAKAYGLEAKSLETHTPEAVQEALLAGNLLVALVGPGHFTKGGHFIVLRGVTLSGEVLVADPNSTERSLTAWDPQLILDELSGSTAYGAPLWVISAPAP